MSTPAPRIAIIGAGPAGLTLATLLRKHCASVSVTIFEHSASATARHQQGGSLDLHPDSGLLALKRMGLFDTARPYLRYEGEELVIADRNGCELVHMKDAPPPKEGEAEHAGAYIRPEIDRERLVNLLLEGLGEENVRWGKHLKRADEKTGKLDFEDGSVEGPFDLVVGADGAWSKVRKVLSEVRPRYSGICGIEGHIPETKTTWPRIDKLVGRGSYFSFSDGKACMAQRMSNDSVKMAVYFNRPEQWVDELAGDEIHTATLREKLLDEFKEWCPEIRELIEVCELSRKWKLYEMPVGSTWDHHAGYTLIGDAAHLCTPFAGLGVNAAMLDAVELSDAITGAIKEGRNLDKAVQSFETAMFPRARAVQHKTMVNKTSGFGEGGPIEFITRSMSVVFEEMGWPLDRGVLYWVPVTKMAWMFFWTKICFTAGRRRLKRMIWGEKSLQG